MFSKKSQTDYDQNHNEPNASTHGPGSANTDSGRGPHKSSLLNKLDPRVDSTTGQRTSGGTRNDGGALGTTSHHGNPAFGTSNTAAHGDPHDTSVASRNTGPANTGPHEPRLAQKIDPRVSPNVDRSNDHMSRDSGYTTKHNSGYSDLSSQTGYGAPNPIGGIHGSHLAHEANHGIDSSKPTPANNYDSGHGNNTTAGSHKSNIMNKLDPRINSDRDDSRNAGMGQGMSNSNSAMMPQEVSSHGHATGLPPGALEGRHAKHTSGNVSNATASATVSGGMVPEGSANASGPTSADAGTTTSNQGGLRGAVKNLTSDPKHFGQHQGEPAPTNRKY